jgi:hypothetical protein
LIFRGASGDNRIMVRLALSTYLVFSTLLGQWLCCCTLPHALPLAAAREASPARPAPHHSSCCCHHEQNAEDRHPAADEPARPRHPERRPCPCRESKANQVAWLSTDSQSDPSSLGLADSVPAPRHATEPARASAATANPQRSGLLFMTAQDLLHVLQILRC